MSDAPPSYPAVPEGLADALTDAPTLREILDENQALRGRAADEQALADKALAALDRMQQRAEKAEAELAELRAFDEDGGSSGYRVGG